MGILDQIAACTGFDWDQGNVLKNWDKHGVSDAECEQVFFNQPLFAADDEAHSVSEPRFYVLGRTDAGRELFLVFTVRGKLIRVISARDMSRKERRSYQLYGQEEKNT
jgi:uncharacterized DUF497 family protein